MKNLLALLLCSLLVGCRSVQHQTRFDALLSEPLTPAQRIAAKEARDDFEAVLDFRKPVHAVPDQFGISDGGSWRYHGRGYDILVWRQWSGVKGGRILSLYGPEVRFDQELFPNIRYWISDTAFYRGEDLWKKLKVTAPVTDESEANQEPEPTSGLAPGRGSS